MRSKRSRPETGCSRTGSGTGEQGRAPRLGAPDYSADMAATHHDRRAHLADERTRLMLRIDELTAGGNIEMEFDDDFADRAKVAGEQGQNLTIADSLGSQLRLVELALKRIDEGSYGICQVCGVTIPGERLEAMPATNACVAHAGTAAPR